MRDDVYTVLQAHGLAKFIVRELNVAYISKANTRGNNIYTECKYKTITVLFSVQTIHMYS